MDKNEFKSKAKQQIDKVFDEINELEKKREEADATVREDYDQKIAELKAKQSKLQEKYDALQDAAEDQWEEAKDAFSAASDSFQKGLSELSSIVK